MGVRRYDFYSGPAFLPWFRMGNMRGFGGPLSRDWIDKRKARHPPFITTHHCRTCQAEPRPRLPTLTLIGKHKLTPSYTTPSLCHEPILRDSLAGVFRLLYSAVSPSVVTATGALDPNAGAHAWSRHDACALSLRGPRAGTPRATDGGNKDGSPYHSAA